MEDLLSIQQQLVGAIEQLYSNFKKDGPERKTGDYIRRRLETLDQYWQEFQNNHFKLCGYSDKSHDYFVTDQFETTKERYGHIRSVIVNYQARDAKPSTSLLRPATPLGGGAATPQPPARTSSPAARADGAHAGENQVTFRAQGVNSRTDELLRKQASNFRALQRKVTSVNLDTELEKWELDDILKTLQSRWSVIDSLHMEIDSELEGKNKEYDSTFYHYEQLYEDIKRSINRKIRSMCHREKSTPQMELPTFSGSFQQWTSFKDLFTETIHTNASLSGAQKMQFLKGKLRGEAERIVQHLQISSDNYITCWEILNNRYNNRKLIFTSHINTLMNIPVSQQASLGYIKRIHDTSLESLNAIKNLGVDISTWDPLLVHILSQKLDADTYNEYVSSLNQPKELPTLKEFLHFLETKFTALETSRKKQENPPAKPSAKYTYNLNHNYSTSDNRFNYKKPTYISQSKVSSNRDNKLAYPIKIPCYYCSNRGHGLYYCAKFLELPSHLKRKLIVDKNLCKNCLYDHEGKACFSQTRCRECNGNHNSILHDVFCNNSFTSKNAESKISKPEVGNTHVSVEGKDPEILLATAMVQVQARDGTYHNIRALLDQGSETTLITERAAHILGLPRKHCQGTITGIGEKESHCRGIIKIKCRSNQEDFSFETNAYIMKTLIKNLPSYSFPKPEWPALENLPLADPFFNVRRPVDLLLGVDVFSNLLLDGIYKAGPTLPMAQKTRLGWILSGCVEKSFKCNIIVHDISDISQFWQSEEISESSSMSLADQQVVDFYNKTTIRLADGKYQVRLPLKHEIESKLGQSKSKAIAQFKQLEQKFNKNLNIAREYKLFINEYKQLGHMIYSNNSDSSDYYLPHHCVIRNESTTTKLRVVFNASSPSSTGLSLNDLMERGPNLQQDLQGLLIKWRQFRFGFTSDVEKMFRVVWLHPDDQKYQKIIWRDSFFDKLSIFQLTTVTYGTKAAPFLAMMTLRRLAQDERQNYQDSSAPKVIESAFYMDDLVYGSHNVESAKRLIQDIISILKSGGFNLRKWKANNQDIIPTSNYNNNEHLNYDFKNTESSKTLGLSWNPQQDQFAFTSKLDFTTKIPTKRILLSNISKLFDPLGWLSPISTKIKLLFQQVWQLQLKWDEPLPENIIKEWESMKTDLENISNFYMPRWLGITENNIIELHGFSDASTKCYACVVYCKVSTHGQTSVTMIAGKSRLVPVNNKLTLPKLELCGALLLTKLLAKIKSCLETYQINYYCWVDSMVVLGWISGVPERWKPFVANRVKQIVEVVPHSSWSYVKSEENPADCASRGLTACQLKNYKLWWNGPTWLKTFSPTNLSQNMQKTFSTEQEVRKTKKVFASITQNQEDNIIRSLLHKYSSLSKIARILAWVYRFINKKQVVCTYLTLCEIKQANIKIIQQCQQEYFSEEIQDLQKRKQVASKSKICMLNPILDQNQVLRVGGRLKHANINLDMKHPIIIPKNSRLSELIIDQCHELTYHGGPKLTSGFIRQRYWLVGGLKATKKRIHQCVKCRKHSPSQHYQIMGDLPSARVNPSRPFYHTGVDYTGHVFVKANKGRGILTTKGYVAVFVCMVTKAVHLELVSDLTTSSFLAALRRMSARRGVPKNMYSDQGTTFIGANKVLQEEFQQILCTFENNEFFNEVTRMGIKWHFNAPSWPSAGGLWEASVKSLKYHMKRVIGEQRLTFEEYSTLLSQLEACINQRPLCAMTEDPDDLNCLTPSHFLTSGQHLAFYNTETDLRTRWHQTQRLFEDIWKKWRLEYLTQLSVRSKWRQPQENIKVNDIVLIQDTNLPGGRWPLGRVLQLHPGSDGFVRVVTLKTKSGIMKRPIVKLSILPVNHEQSAQSIKNKDDDIKQVYHVTKPSKKNTYSFSKLVFTILLFIMTLISSSEGSFNLTPLQNQSLYFDKVTSMALIKDEWRLVVYYDMSPYWEGSLTASKYLEYLQNICDSKQDHSQCVAIMLQLHHGYEQLSHYNNVMMSKQTSRVRRGLINGVGNIANSLFGVLDSKFAEKYEQDIQLIKKNQDHLAILWKNQTSVVEAEFNLLKRTENIMTKQHKIINLRLNQVEQQLNATKKENLENYDFILSAIVASNLISHLKEMQDTLLDTMTNIYNGQLSLHLLTPDQLRQELNIISGKISKDLCLPFENISLPNIYHLLKVKARMSTNYLLFETKIPLVHRDNFEIHKSLAVPRLVNNNIMTYMKPVSSYLAINIKKDALLPMTEGDVKSCLQQESGTLLCRSRSPVYSLTVDESLCEKDAASRRCKVYQEPCRSQWHELHQVNTYFYFYCQEQNVKVLCDDQVSSLQLLQAGLLMTNQGCLLKFKDFTVYTHKQEVSDVHIKADVTAPRLSPINYLVNISIPNNGATSTGDEDGISEHSRQLTRLQEQIKEMQQTVPLYNSVSSHDIHHYTATYVIVIVAALGAGIWGARRIRRRRSARAAAEQVAQRARRAAPPTAEVVRRQLPSSSTAVNDNQCVCSESDKCVKMTYNQCVCNESDKCVKKARYTSYPNLGYSGPCKQDFKRVSCSDVPKQNKGTSPTFRSVYVIGDDSVKFNSL